MKPIFKRTDAVNCFTSGLAYVLSCATGSNIKEVDLLRCGEGFQFQSSFDEYGFPEYIFEVLPTCLMALDRFGTCLNCLTLGENLEAGDIPDLLREVGQIIVWVNSKFMVHADIYAKRDGYIHAIVIESYDRETGSYAIFDPLIVDKVPVSCITYMRDSQLVQALSSKVEGNELAPEMGKVFYVDRSQSTIVPNDIVADVRRQAVANVHDPRHANAIDRYHQNCLNFFAKDIEKRRRAARRLFDHISPLFVLPSITHLKGTLSTASANDDLLLNLNQLEHLWKELAILALKFEATDSENVLDRIDGKFAMLAKQNLAFWKKSLQSSWGR